MSKRKLTENEVREIRCLNRLRIHYRGMADVYCVKNIANKYAVSPTTVNAIIDGYSYANVPDVETMQ